MNPPEITIERQREAIERLRRLAEFRAAEELRIRARYEGLTKELEAATLAERSRLTENFRREHGQLIEAFQTSRETLLFAYESAGAALAVEEETFRDKAATEHAEMLDDAKTAWELQTKQIEEAYVLKEATRDASLAEFHRNCDSLAEQLKATAAEAESFLRRRGLEWPAELPAAEPAGEALTPRERLERAAAALQHARQTAQLLPQQSADKFLRAGWPALIFFLLIPAAAPLCWWLFAGLGWIWVLAGSVLLPAAIALIVWQSVRPVARRQVLAVVPPLQQALQAARAETTAARQAANLDALQRKQRRGAKRQRALAAAKAALEAARQSEIGLHEASLKAKAECFRQERAAVEEDYERRLTEIEAEHPPRIEKAEREYERAMVELSARFNEQRARLDQDFQAEKHALAEKWESELTTIQSMIGQMNAYCQTHFPPWENVDPSAFHGTNGQAADIAAVRFGRYSVPLAAESAASDADAAPGSGWGSFELPAVLSYPGRPSLLLEADGEGRSEANRALQNVMLRLLAAFPPGKVRFTIIDPVGLGQNFSAFMHLADYDPRLVNNRIWTESAHINQRLADLTEHMEDVIQKYLRNEFDSIQQYNRQAGEVAEPLQVLVVANFPANFSDEAARRLASIAASGARCGVYTLISTDSRLKLPKNFDLADLERPAATLVWSPERAGFIWKDAALLNLPVAIDEPPADEKFTALVRGVGRGAQASSRVEVPFSAVLPPDEAWWAGDSRGEIEVPLGRAGAMKLQMMRLGRGTSQHVLIAGKTGSGKSTLLNALITNLAAHYSPSELEFYLIDFKKGVEFKAYAAHRLPHARVIAIESEREFGMSVLERLDAELKRRGDLLRQAGAQDLKGYRSAHPQAVLPRVLLIIDEFQEFFTNDDKIAHDSGLLLDRLVRQGRAFGIHVLLGSQTLAGAYSLARSTIGQMAVRIALQCSESDAHLILSEENSAARLLSRPGEAIYNDANGLFEGNHPFQVVWLSDAEREAYLSRITRLAEERGITQPPPTIFEGNAPANPAENHLLQEVLAGSTVGAGDGHMPRAWLGAAVAIKDPTEVTFRRQGGGNLAIVGQAEELAHGIMANCLISLAAQLPPAPAVGDFPASFVLLDGSRAEAPEAGSWRKLVRHLPIGAELGTPADAAALVGRLAAEVDRRLTLRDEAFPPLFLFVYNLARFRDLKKSDDFSFGDDAGAGSARHFATILREGPAVGVHTVLWCDSYGNLNRWLDRQSIRDLDHRVLFQMSASDSSNLMDSPAASRLGGHVALYYSEELGRAEKFRPYGWPTAEWTGWVAERLDGRRQAAEQLQVGDEGLEPPTLSV